jgi:transcriptional regulator with XRE-family HTH domain
MAKPSTVGERIRFFRRLAGLRQRELAERVGVHRSAVCQWERGMCSPSLPNLEKVVRACGIEMRAFWGDIGGDK